MNSRGWVEALTRIKTSRDCRCGSCSGSTALSSAVSVASFSGPVADLADVAGVAVGLLAGGAVVEWMDLTAGTFGYIGAVTPIRRIAAVPGTRRFVVEIETSDDPLASIGANLWLFGLP